MSIAASSLEPLGHNLHRPECVLHQPCGTVHVPDWRGGITTLHPDGRQSTLLAVDGPPDLKPNGIALMDDGGFLIANLGEAGGVWAMDAAGHVTPFLTTLNGHPMPAANFVTQDAQGRTWITVSTPRLPRQQAWRRDVRDGFVVRVDTRGAVIVADGLHYTNEARVSPCGAWLYVVETFGQRLIRMPLNDAGQPGPRETVAQFGDAIFPDGFAFDAEGGIWVTSLICNGLIRIHPDGGQQIMLMEDLPDHSAPLAAAFAQGALPANALGPIPGARLQHVTSIAFGGSDNRTAVIGTLHNDAIFRFAL
ncbi:SMP-30/gluconolactonase/LRE family protein [Novosphingobium sp.]|uniref:SMP-30/gluconolactonase/LRE family protein n=1 Tax=Novosphingobium sp. TaxID=1874826 RepID=UPI0031DA32BE